ncbi:MAG: hypothetical protein ACYCZI_04115 [Metallibacterium scheffleri]
MGAYVTGTANSYADLLAALQTACTANGYTLTGNVLSKGTLFIEAKVVGSTLQIQGGSGQAAGVLSGRSNAQPSLIGLTITTASPTVNHPIVFPVTYDIHINTAPDEVYLWINYEATCYQYLAFGQSDQPGLVGTGNWYYGTAGTNTNGSSWDFRTIGGGVTNGSNFNCGLFDALQNYFVGVGGIDHQLDAAGNWSGYYSASDRWPVQQNSPSAWNGESVLSPIIVYAARPSSLFSQVLQTRHLRWVMLDNLTDGQIVTLGPDRWKMYPLWRRSSRTLIPTPAGQGTGTLGYAVRYNGP